MKRSGIFITTLFALLMFQSLWNVAAAFCSHEIANGTSAEISNQHFGHHVALNCLNDGHRNSQKHTPHLASNDMTHMKDVVQNFQNDHRDHLPSFIYFIAVDTQQYAYEPLLSVYISVPKIDWKNLYQSPHLNQQNPPPLFSPL